MYIVCIGIPYTRYHTRAMGP